MLTIVIPALLITSLKWCRSWIYIYILQDKRDSNPWSPDPGIAKGQNSYGHQVKHLSAMIDVWYAYSDNKQTSRPWTKLFGFLLLLETDLYTYCSPFLTNSCDKISFHRIENRVNQNLFGRHFIFSQISGFICRSVLYTN